MSLLKNKNWSNYFWLRSTGFPFEDIESLGFFENNDLLNQIIQLEDEILFLDNEKLKETENNIRFKKKEFTKRYQLIVEKKKEYFLSLIKKEPFREALYLSNHEALLRIDSLVNTGIETINSKKRQRIKLAWNYLQRFYTKNDTVSFFGPITWGKFNGQENKNICEPISNNHWIAKKNVKFEYWVINSLINCISKKFKHNMPLQLNNGCSLFNDILYYPLNKSKKLNIIQSKLINFIINNKDTSYSSVISLLSTSIYEKKKLLNLLNMFLSKGILIQTFNISPNSEYPLIELLKKWKNLYSQMRIYLINGLL
jgi:hypothetical protein